MKCNSGSILMRESRAKKHSEVVCDTRLTRGAWRSISVGIPDRSRELRHNIEACVPSRTTSPLLLLITNWMKRRATNPPALASAAHFAAGRPVRTTAGLAPAALSGTRSTRQQCAPPASTSGLQPSASSVAAGRRIRIGIARNGSRHWLALSCLLPAEYKKPETWRQAIQGALRPIKFVAQWFPRLAGSGR